MENRVSFSKVYKEVIDEFSPNLTDILNCVGLYLFAYFVYSIIPSTWGK
jgi:hypothetical protein